MSGEYNKSEIKVKGIVLYFNQNRVRSNTFVERISDEEISVTTIDENPLTINLKPFSGHLYKEYDIALKENSL